MVEEESKRKRITICRKDGLTTRFEYGFVTNQELEESLRLWAATMKVDYDSIITYTLGDQDAETDGVLYFCPKCGAYNEFGYEPTTRMYYRKEASTGKLEKAGYHKNNLIDCFNCDEKFEIHTDKYNEESKSLTDLYFEGKKNEGIKN